MRSNRWAWMDPLGSAWSVTAWKKVVRCELHPTFGASSARRKREIVGAPKAREKGYGYSTALASAGGMWTQQDLNDYLAAPDKFLPGTKKTIIGLPKPKERAELIAFLATLKD